MYTFSKDCINCTHLHVMLYSIFVIFISYSLIFISLYEQVQAAFTCMATVYHLASAYSFDECTRYVCSSCSLYESRSSSDKQSKHGRVLVVLL